jgi:hypothetical protein
MPDDKHISSNKEVLTKTADIGSGQPAKEILRIRLKGKWNIGEKLPSADDVQKQIESSGSIRKVGFKTDNLTD